MQLSTDSVLTRRETGVLGISNLVSARAADVSGQLDSAGFFAHTLLYFEEGTQLKPLFDRTISGSSTAKMITG